MSKQSGARYKSLGRKLVNLRKKFERKLARALKAIERAEKRGRKTKMSKVVAELQAAMKKKLGE